MSESALIYNVQAPRKAVNLTINSDLLQKARQLKINLSQTLERELAELIRKTERERWISENQDAIEAYNERVERDGVFSDKLRTF